MAEDIRSKTARAKLTPRAEPYWSRIRTGLYVGYRKLPSGEGTWIGRRRGEDGKQKYHSVSELPSYDDAVKAVEAWSMQLDQGVESFDATVGDACRQYVEYLRVNKGPKSAADAEGRFRRYIYEKSIGRIPLAKLQTRHTRDWQHAFLGDDEPDDEEDLRRAKDSANRNLSSLKAALNLALKDRLVATDAGWKTITAFKGVGRRREYLLSLEEQQLLVDALPVDMQPLAKALLCTGARPGEMAQVTVRDFDPRQKTLTIQQGKTRRRIVPLHAPVARFFAEQCKGKIGTAPMFSTDNGMAWNKDDWKKPFKDTVRALNLPEEVVMYHLRHAAISGMLMGGMQIAIAAQLTGTSVRMIELHYGHLLHDQTRAIMDRVRMIAL